LRKQGLAVLVALEQALLGHLVSPAFSSTRVVTLLLGRFTEDRKAVLKALE
jgi:hypothetical protein